MILLPPLYHPCSRESRILFVITAWLESRCGQPSSDAAGQYRLKEEHFAQKNTQKADFGAGERRPGQDKEAWEIPEKRTARPLHRRPTRI
jgi:hypothetical protein